MLNAAAERPVVAEAIISYYFAALFKSYCEKPKPFGVKQILVAAVCLIAGTVQAQTKKFDFKLGGEYELPRKTTDLAFVGNDQDGILNLSIKKEELIVVQFDPKTLAKTMERRIDIPEASRNLNSEFVTDFHNGKYFWLHSDWDKSNEREILYGDLIDLKAGKMATTNNQLFSTAKIAGTSIAGGFYNFKTIDKFSFKYSFDEKKLLVTYRSYPEVKNDKKNLDKLGFQVFDENMKLIWGGEFTMPYTEAVMDNADFTVDADGNAYLLTKVYDSDSRRERDKETGKPAYRYEVFKFSKGAKQPTIAKILLDDYFILQSTIIENAAHDIMIASTYSKKKKSTSTDGIFLANLDANGQLVKFKKGYYEFPLEELAKFESARKRRRMERKDDYEADHLKVRNVVVESDGSIFVACEEFIITEHYRSNYGANGVMTGGSFYYTYDYNDIIATKIDATGNMQWVRKIPKMQHGLVRTGTMGFKLVSDATGYYFLYLDNIRNMQLGDTEVPKTHADGYGGQVIVSTIDNNGKHSKELLFDTRDEDIMIFPQHFYRIDGHRYIGRARLKKNQFQPLLITSK